MTTIGAGSPSAIYSRVNGAALSPRRRGPPAFVDEAVYDSERRTGHRNSAIAHLLLNCGMVHDEAERALEVYFRQCSILVSCRDLAVMGATLANMGRNPLTGHSAFEIESVKRRNEG